MRKSFWIYLFCFLPWVGFGQSIEEVVSHPPKPPRLVNDYANVLSADQLSSLEQKLVSYDDSTSVQIAIITVATTGNTAIDDAALEILRKWGVGNNKTNNGVVILAAIQDHKIFIAPGYGMESVIPDIVVKQIIESEIVPNFRAGNYFRGFNNATDDIIHAAAGTFKAPEGYGKRGQGDGGDVGSIIGIIILVVIVLWIIRRRGGGGGGMVNRSGFFPWMIASMMSNRSGGWSGGGGFGGGGFGGGGFGGFGGGGGGGGGAGGSW